MARKNERVSRDTLTRRPSTITSSVQPLPSGIIKADNGASGNLSEAFSYLDEASSMSSIGSSLSWLPFIGDTVSSVFDSQASNAAEKAKMVYNSMEAMLSRNYNTKEREATQAFNVDMWNKNNEYNSLSAQIERAREAGVSPSAVIGQGGNTAVSSPVTSSPQSSAPASVGSNLSSDFINRSLEREALKAQIKNTEADTDNKKYELNWNTLSQNERLEGLRLSNDNVDASTQEILNRIGIEKVDSIIRQRQEIRLSMLDEATLLERFETINVLRNESLDLISQIEFRKINGEYTAVLKNQAIAETELTKEKKNTELKQQELIGANVSLAGKQETALDKQIGLYEAQTLTEQTTNNLTEEQVVDQKLQNQLTAFQVAFSNITKVPIGTPDFMLDFMLMCTGDYETYYLNMQNHAVRSYLGQGVVPYASSRTSPFENVHKDDWQDYIKSNNKRVKAGKTWLPYSGSVKLPSTTYGPTK